MMMNAVTPEATIGMGSSKGIESQPSLPNIV